jgi:hypothetical protein
MSSVLSDRVAVASFLRAIRFAVAALDRRVVSREIQHGVQSDRLGQTRVEAGFQGAASVIASIFFLPSSARGVTPPSKGPAGAGPPWTESAEETRTV